MRLPPCLLAPNDMQSWSPHDHYTIACHCSTLYPLFCFVFHWLVPFSTLFRIHAWLWHSLVPSLIATLPSFSVPPLHSPPLEMHSAPPSSCICFVLYFCFGRREIIPPLLGCWHLTQSIGRYDRSHWIGGGGRWYCHRWRIQQRIWIGGTVKILIVIIVVGGFGRW